MLPYVTIHTWDKDVLCLRSFSNYTTALFIFGIYTLYISGYWISHVAELWSAAIRPYSCVEWRRVTESIPGKLYISLQKHKMLESLFPQRSSPDCEVKLFYLGLSDAMIFLKKTITKLFPQNASLGLGGQSCIHSIGVI